MIAAPTWHTPTLPDPTPAAGRVSNPLRGWRITFGGLLYIVIVILVAIAALNSEANLLFLLAGIAAGVGVFSMIAPLRLVRRIEVERTVPVAVVAGRAFNVQYTVRNRRNWLSAWSLVIGEASVRGAARHFPCVLVPMIPAGRELRLSVRGQCPSRGRVELSGIRITCRFPFGLFLTSLVIEQPAELIVCPAVGRIRSDPWRQSRNVGSQPTRTNRTQHTGEEFYGVREYRQGDNLRWIHWRRSARVGELVVREMTRMHVTQMTVLVDPWPDAGRVSERDGPVLEAERLISGAASVICDGLERGYRVGLIGRGRDIELIAPGGGRLHRQRLLEALALLEPGPSDALAAILPRVRWSSSGQTRYVLCATRFDDSHHRLSRHLARRADAMLMLSSPSATLEALVELPTVEGGHR